MSLSTLHPLLSLTLAPSTPSTPSSRVNIHPHLIGERELRILLTKAHLVIRMIQLKIGQDLLLQVLQNQN